MLTDLNFYLKILENIEAEIKFSTGQLLEYDLENLLIDLLSQIKEVIDVPKLEDSILTYENLDLGMIRRSLKIFKISKFERLEFKAPNFTYVLKVLIQGIEKGLNGLEKDQVKAGRRGVLIYLNFYLDRDFNYALMCFEGEEKELSQLIDLVASKIRELPNDEIMQLWGRVLGELESFSRDDVNIGDGIVGAEFSKINDPQEVVSKISEYVVRIKPQLGKRKFEKNEGYPNNVIGVAHLLSLKTKFLKNSPTGTDLALLQTLSELVFLWENIFKKPKIDICRRMGIEVEGRIASGIDYRDMQESRTTMKVGIPFLILVIKKIITYVSVFVNKVSPVEKALWQYKLGLEVTMPDSGKMVGGKREISLQNELCKYLLDRGIYSFGTKFGRSETDLMHEQMGEKIVLETKIYKKVPTSKKLKSNIVQLKSYLDQVQINPRGVLLIYNLSDSVLIGPGKWIRGRYWILPINLGKLAPSERSDSIEIEEGKESELLNLISIKSQKR